MMFEDTQYDEQEIREARNYDAQRQMELYLSGVPVKVTFLDDEIANVLYYYWWLRSEKVFHDGVYEAIKAERLLIERLQ